MNTNRRISILERETIYMDLDNGVVIILFAPVKSNTLKIYE